MGGTALVWWHSLGWNLMGWHWWRGAGRVALREVAFSEVALGRMVLVGWHSVG